jgi:hypothetical protein
VHIFLIGNESKLFNLNPTFNKQQIKKQELGKEKNATNLSNKHSAFFEGSKWKLPMTKRNKKSKALKWNEDQPPNLKKKPPKDPQWFATSKAFSHVQRMKIQSTP